MAKFVVELSNYGWVNDAQEYGIALSERVDGRNYRQTQAGKLYRRHWAMFSRCYTPEKEVKWRFYADCHVDKSFHKFSDFYFWFKREVKESEHLYPHSHYHLDKDILVSGNKVYAADRCVLVSNELNKILCDSGGTRGEYAVGVGWHNLRRKFRARCYFNGEQEHLGLFRTELEAHKAWQLRKAEALRYYVDFLNGEEYLRHVSNKEAAVKVSKALKHRIDLLTNDYSNDRITLSI